MEKEKKDIVIIGATNTDISGKCLYPLVMSDSNIGKISTSLGGVGHNIALNLSRMGKDVSFITSLGSDNFGANARKELESVMDISNSVFFHGSSGVYLYVSDEKGEMIVAVNDMSAAKEITPSFLETKKEIIESAPFLVLDANLEEESIQYASRIAKGIVVCDAVSTVKAGRLVSSFSNIDILKPNLMELEYLSGAKITGEKSIRDAGFALIEKGVGTVVATAGENGAYYITLNRFLHAYGSKLDVKNTNGAGDSFLSGFVFALSEGLDEKDSLKMALSASRITIMEENTVSNNIEGEILYKLSKEIKVEEVS